MPRGVARDRRWRGNELLRDWVARQPRPPCACGCGEHVVIQPHHRRYGIPRFITGHYNATSDFRDRYAAVRRWVNEHQGQHACACGCGEPIAVLVKHHSRGIPKYLPGHHVLRRDRQQMHPRSAMGFSASTRREIWTRCAGKCVRCGIDDPRILDFDHVIPIAWGGTREPCNGQLLCCNCHRIKSREQSTFGRTRRRPRNFKEAVNDDPGHPAELP